MRREARKHVYTSAAGQEEGDYCAAVATGAGIAVVVIVIVIVVVVVVTVVVGKRFTV